MLMYTYTQQWNALSPQSDKSNAIYPKIYSVQGLIIANVCWNVTEKYLIAFKSVIADKYTNGHISIYVR